MKRHVMTLLALSMLASQVHAAPDSVYLCVDEQGNKTYKNTGATKGCKKVDLPGITTVPAPKRTVAANGARKAEAPSSFPKVDTSAQRTRDGERRQILQDERKAEEQKLAELKAEFNNGEPERRGDERNYAKYQERVARLKAGIEQSEKNLQALDRELANLK